MSPGKPAGTIDGHWTAVSQASKRKMVLWFCLIAAALIISGFFYYSSELDQIRQLRISELSAISKIKVRQIQRWRKERIADITQLAEAPFLSRALEEWFHKSDDAVLKKNIVQRLKLATRTGIYTQVLLMDADAHVLFSFPETVEVSDEIRNVVKEAWNQPGVLMSELHSEVPGEAHVDIIATMRSVSGRPLAVAILTNDAREYLFPMIEAWPTPSRSGETLLVRRDGSEVLFLNELRHRKKTALSLHFPLSLTTLPAVQAVLGRTGIFYGKDYMGQEVVADLRPVPGTDWFLVTQEGEAEIQREVRFRALTVFLAVLMLILCVAGGMAFWYSTLQLEERKRTETLLRDSETRYRRLFEAAKDGILILDAETGMIVDANPYLIEILGYSHEKLLGKTIWDVGCFKDVLASKDHFLKLQQEKYVCYDDLPLETADGRKIDVEFVSNVYQVDHRKVIQCNVRDITERKRLERELAQAKEARFRTLVESLPQKVFFKDINSIYVSCNSNYARDLKIKPEEIAGKTDYDFFPTPLAEKYRKDDQRIMKSGKTESCEEEYHVIKNYLEGSQKSYVQTVKAPIRDQHGNVTGLFGLFWDITDRKMLEKEKNRVEVLAAAAEAKARFISMISHELKSPISVIVGALEIALDGLTGQINDELKEVLEVAKRNSERLISLIGNVLDFQKIESGKMKYNISKNDLNEVIKEILQSMGVLAKAKGLDLRVELEEGLPQMKFDQDRLIQVLANLMNNAIQHTENGSITLSAKKEKGVVHVRVQDTGSGIPAEEIPKLFQPFEQVGGLSRRQKGGTGLGLAISKEIILAHHGKIWVESDTGKGSSFHFILPL
ncbi:MAG: PAS domain S-box protein [Candidatus Omnitrophota bacterium]